MSKMDWETRYQTGDMPWEKGEASPGLVDFLSTHPDLERGSVCVPGCGLGHDARVWARGGFDVTGLDLAPSAIRQARELTEAAGLKAHFDVGDFLRDEPPQIFDWIFEHTLFCAIDPAERDEYTRAIQHWLKPGGDYLAINYLIPDRDGPPFGTTLVSEPDRAGTAAVVAAQGRNRPQIPLTTYHFGVKRVNRPKAPLKDGPFASSLAGCLRIAVTGRDGWPGRPRRSRTSCSR
jgi:SAM-dependent methyltransferase